LIAVAIDTDQAKTYWQQYLNPNDPENHDTFNYT